MLWLFQGNNVLLCRFLDLFLILLLFHILLLILLLLLLFLITPHGLLGVLLGPGVDHLLVAFAQAG